MAQQTSAYDKLNSYYSSLGLASLAPKILEYLQKGMGDDEVYLNLQQTTEWKERFRGNEIRRQKGLAPLSPDQYLAKEESIAEEMRRYGLPKGFYDDPGDYAKLIGANVGREELRGRLDARKAVVEDGANTGVLAYAREKYGFTTGDLIAYFTDPDRAAPLLTKMAAASQIGAAAARTKWGDLAKDQAERLADMGVTTDQAQSGLATAAGLTELTAEGAGTGTVTRQDLLGAVFDNDEEARRRVTRVQEERKALFAGGGGFATSQTGVVGLGSANT